MNTQSSLINKAELTKKLPLSIIIVSWMYSLTGILVYLIIFPVLVAIVTFGGFSSSLFEVIIYLLTPVVAIIAGTGLRKLKKYSLYFLFILPCLTIIGIYIDSLPGSFLSIYPRDFIQFSFLVLIQIGIAIYFWNKKELFHIEKPFN
jgi:integral membrane sensor domain MASE1